MCRIGRYSGNANDAGPTQLEIVGDINNATTRIE
jgi:hypothetical protein